MSDVIGRVLIKCPKSGTNVHTVYRLRPSAFEALRGEYSFRCDRCGDVHTWKREDAWLEDASRLRTVDR
jgi:uncharacterized C2H2 Zn-finger protein